MKGVFAIAPQSPTVALEGFPALLADLLSHHLALAQWSVVALGTLPDPELILQWADENDQEPALDDPRAALTIIVADTPAAARRWRPHSAVAISAKDIDIESLLDLARGTHRGQKTRPPVTGGPAPPTDRELEVMELVAAGRSTEEIAVSLGISPHTVRTHIRQVMSRLGVSSRAAAVVQLAREGLLRSYRSDRP